MGAQGGVGRRFRVPGVGGALVGKKWSSGPEKFPINANPPASRISAVARQPETTWSRGRRASPSGPATHVAHPLVLSAAFGGRAGYRRERTRPGTCAVAGRRVRPIRKTGWLVAAVAGVDGAVGERGLTLLGVSGRWLGRLRFRRVAGDGCGWLGLGAGWMLALPGTFSSPNRFGEGWRCPRGGCGEDPPPEFVGDPPRTGLGRAGVVREGIGEDPPPEFVGDPPRTGLGEGAAGPVAVGSP